MGDFEDATSDTVDQAVGWAKESTERWFGAYVRLVDGAAEGTTTADAYAKDMAELTTGGMRDMARVVATWVALGEAIVKVKPNGSAPAPPPASAPPPPPPQGS